MHSKPVPISEYSMVLVIYFFPCHISCVCLSQKKKDKIEGHNQIFGDRCYAIILSYVNGLAE